MVGYRSGIRIMVEICCPNVIGKVVPGSKLAKLDIGVSVVIVTSCSEELLKAHRCELHQSATLKSPFLDDLEARTYSGTHLDGAL